MKHIRRLLCSLIPAVILAACGAQPTPSMYGAERITTVAGGRQYVLFRKENMVEVIRLGWVSPGGHQAVRAQMVAIVPHLTGCHLVPSTIQGDSGEMRGRVTCRAGA